MRTAVIRLARSVGLFYLARRMKMSIYNHVPPRWRDDREDLQFYSPMVRTGDLVFDVGANVGIKTKTFRGLGARVVCVEPNQAVLKELKRVFGRDPMITIVPEALAAQKGWAELTTGKDFSGLSTMSDRWRTEGRYAEIETWGQVQKVRTTTLDDLILRYGVPSFCKIDVEGFEPEVIAGLSRTLPLLSFEFHAELWDEAVVCMKRLEALKMSEFNYTLGEGRDWMIDRWVTGGELIGRLEAHLDHLVEGEIYARTPR